jgi:chromosome partitioning protein
MIIVLGSQKGGVSKNTLAVSIAAFLMSLGRRLLMLMTKSQFLHGTTVDLKSYPKFQ